MKHAFRAWLLLFGLAASTTLAGCVRPAPNVTIVATVAPLVALPESYATQPTAQAQGGGIGNPPPAVAPPTPERNVTPYIGTPTPNPTPNTGEEGSYLTHSVNPGETLASIALHYGSTVDELISINGLADGDFLYAGQILLVPSLTSLTGPEFKIIPDSELVYGPAARDFDTVAFARGFNGYLANYQEVVEGQTLSGPEIIDLIANRFSINPRLLLAALEFRAGWVTQANPGNLDYPFGRVDVHYKGLYQQLRWAADRLNWGFYGPAEGGVTSFVVGDDTRVTFASGLNYGTTAVQMWLAAHEGATLDGWLQDTSPTGFFATFGYLFGNPFAYTVDPLIPGDLQQPAFALPWAGGETWYFTGGPHGGWASGSAWAALDFVPGTEQLGCYTSDAWVRAVAPGIVTRSNFGAVVVDLDGDGFAGTGWAVIYMHLETRDRVAPGTYVETGTPLGHPSCEGGFSNGTHVHLARTYNGRWIAADGNLPFILDGWHSQGLGREYDGLLVRGDEVKEACECRGEANAITAD